jgi:hypothetical protein
MKSETIIARPEPPIEKPPRNAQAAASLVWVAAAVPGYWCMLLLLHMLPSHIFGQSVASLHHPSLGHLQGYGLIMTYVVASILTASGIVLGCAIWRRNKLALWLTIGLYVFITLPLFMQVADRRGPDLIGTLLLVYCVLTLFLLSLAFPAGGNNIDLCSTSTGLLKHAYTPTYIQ